MSPKQAQSTFNLHFKNGILWRRCKSCVIAYWLGSTEPIWSIMIISVGLQFFSVFSWAKYKSTTGAIMIKKFKFCFHRQIAYFQELLLEKTRIESELLWSSIDHIHFFAHLLVYSLSSPKYAQSTCILHFKNQILLRRCKSCVMTYWFGSKEYIWSTMIISVCL